MNITHTPVNTDPVALIAYHANCPDGQTAAFVAWKALGRSAATVPVNYDLHNQSLEAVFTRLVQALPEGQSVGDTTLYVLDFSFPIGMLFNLGERFANIIVIDHHKTAYEDLNAIHSGVTYRTCNDVKKTVYELSDNVTIHFCMEESGALMTWRHFFGEKADVPEFVQYVSDRDLWKFTLKNTRPFTAGLSLYRNVPWTDLDRHFDSPDELIQQGHVAESYNNSRIENTLKKGVKFLKTTADDLQEWKIGVFNAPADITSDLLSRYVNANGNPPVGMTYTIGSDDTVYCSLRSVANVDCSWIARTMGGGGHAQACGFIVPLNDWVKILQSGELTLQHRLKEWGYRWEGSGEQPGYHLVEMDARTGQSLKTVSYIGTDQNLSETIDTICEERGQY